MPATATEVLYAGTGTPYFAPPPPADSGSSGDVGMIVGIVCGSLAALALAALAAVWLVKRRRRARAAAAQAAAERELARAETQRKFEAFLGATASAKGGSLTGSGSPGSPGSVADAGGAPAWTASLAPGSSTAGSPPP